MEAELDVADPAGRETRPVAWDPDPGRLQQADHAGPLASVWLQQLQHSRVVGSRLSRKRPGHQIGDMSIAETDGVGVAEGNPRRLGRCPRSDAPYLLQAGIRIGRRQRHQGLDLGSAPADQRQKLGPATLQAQGMELEVGDFRKAGSRRRQEQARGSRCRLPETADDGGICGECFAGSHLLAEDGRHERRQQLAGAGQSQAGESTLQLPEQGMPRLQGTRVVQQPCQPWGRLQGRGRAGPPGLGSDRAAAISPEAETRRAGLRTTGQPHAVSPDTGGWIAAAVLERR